MFVESMARELTTRCAEVREMAIRSSSAAAALKEMIQDGTDNALPLNIGDLANAQCEMVSISKQCAKVAATLRTLLRQDAVNVGLGMDAGSAINVIGTNQRKLGIAATHNVNEVAANLDSSVFDSWRACRAACRVLAIASVQKRCAQFASLHFVSGYVCRVE